MTRSDLNDCRHLERVIKLDEKATGDYWIYQDQSPWDDDPIIQAVTMNSEGTYPESLTAICHNIEGDDRPNDMEAIAAYRTLAPSMARALLAIHEIIDAHDERLPDAEIQLDAIKRILKGG